MLRKVLWVAVALALAGVAQAEKTKKDVKKGKKAAYGKQLEWRSDTGVISILVKKDKKDEGTKTDYKMTNKTKFAIGAGKGKKPTVLTDDKEILEKFPVGTMVYIMLDEDGKTATMVIAAQGKKPKKQDE